MTFNIRHCSQCNDAQKDPLSRSCNPDCPDCVIRDLAHEGKESRDFAYDVIERTCGPDARRRVIEMVMGEHARIVSARKAA